MEWYYLSFLRLISIWIKQKLGNSGAEIPQWGTSHGLSSQIVLKKKKKKLLSKVNEQAS